MKVSFRKLNAKEKNILVNMIQDWISNQKIYSGEALFQCDRGWLESPQLVAQIIDDVIQPEVDWEDG